MTAKAKIHLICNAHLDPAWLWEIEEGAGEALSTFRIAADFCERFDGFVFNHNEVILYEWVEEYDPRLFERIRRLVREGRWHIMGGWFLQPDCNMPSGESFVRQMLAGRKYFMEKFGARPATAINFDPFGHSRGLVQLMSKAGFDSYIFCRPGGNDCPLPGEDFRWIGFDGSSVVGHRAYKAYLSGRGKARAKVEGWMADHPERRLGLVLWGIGNHGGGPSRVDLEQLAGLAAERADAAEILHSTPEAYFRELRGSGAELPAYAGDLNAWAVGCYTSQVRIKQKHRRLENELFAVERMASHAALAAGMAYPKAELREACRDLMIAQFHDMLPGSSVEPVEEATLRLLDHGLEIVSRVRARAFFALARSGKKPAEGEVPVFVYNPHAYPVRALIETEFQLQEHSQGRYAEIAVRSRTGQRIAAQTEKELCSLYVGEWRKRVAFEAVLEPLALNRFDCTAEWTLAKKAPQAEVDGVHYVFRSDRLELRLNRETGRVDRWRTDGVDYVKEGAFAAIVMEDTDDSWGSDTREYRKKAGGFKLMTPDGALAASGLRNGGPEVEGKGNGKLPAVRVIEEGEVRTLVEALFEYRRSTVVMRYSIPKRGAEVRLDVGVNWNEPKKMLKLAVPIALSGGETRFLGQTAYGTNVLTADGRETAAQKWVAVAGSGQAFSCVNDGTYGCDCDGVELRLSLLRSPGYSTLPGGNVPDPLPKDRHSRRIDIGERSFTFWFQGGPAEERLASVDREAAAHNEKPYALSYFPPGDAEEPGDAAPGSLAELSGDSSILLSAFKQSEGSEREEADYIIRLYEPTGRPRSAALRLPQAGLEFPVELAPFEVKTLRWRTGTGSLAEESLTEEW